MDLLHIIATLGVVAAGAFLQGVVGLGLNLFASPLLILINPGLVPAPIMAGALLLTVLVSLRDRTGIDRRVFGWMSLGMLPGSALAGVLLPYLPVRTLGLVLGLLVLVGVAVTLSGLRIPGRGWVLFSAGFLSGAGGTLASIGGPPVALVNQEMEARRLRATLSAYFTLSAVVALVTLALAGRLGQQEGELTLVVLPGVVLGFLLSIPLARRLNRSWSRAAVLGLSAASALLLLWQLLH